MSVTQVGAVYGTASRLLQRIYIPHADDNEIDRQHVHPKETMVRMPLEIYRHGGAVAVQAMVGKPTTSGRCAIMHKDTGRFIEYCLWDITVHGNRHPDGHLIVEA